MADGAELALEGLSHTVDKIPDRHWDKLPGLKPKEKERRRDKRSSKGHHGLSDSESDQSYSRGDRKKDSRTQDRSRDTRSSFDGTQNRTSWAQQGRAETTRAMGDSYYPPPPPAGDYPRRYNPQDYQPRNESYQPRNEEYHSYANTNYGPEQYAPSVRCRKRELGRFYSSHRPLNYLMSNLYRIARLS